METLEERPFQPGRGGRCRMLMLQIPRKEDATLSVLCLGAHSDDIEIGCGGTILHLRATLPCVKFHWVVFSALGVRSGEAKKAVDLFTGDCEKQVELKGFRDGFLPYSGGEVKDYFETLKVQVNPDLILTHWRGDAHQDHRMVSELARNTFRNHLIWEYEIPKYDGDMGRPNVFVPLQAPLYQQKIDYLLEAFESQRSKRWFEAETFQGLMRLRGMECNASSGYAEAFHCYKMVI